MVEHKQTCLKINVEQTVKLRSGSIKFKNNFKQIAVSFNIYGDFECNLEKTHTNERVNNTPYTEKISRSYSLQFYKEVVCVDDISNKPVVLYRAENSVYKFIEAILK